MAAPLALLLGAGLVLPLLAHMARQVPRDRQAFGAMLLLQRVVKRLKRRRRVKDLPLLLLRLLALAALVLAATGLELTFPGGVPEYGGSGRVVLVVDRSMSMGAVGSAGLGLGEGEVGGNTLLREATTRAISTLRSLPDAVQVGLVVYDDEAVKLTSELTTDRGRLEAALLGLTPSYGGSDLRGALLEARRLLEGEPGEVLLFSDEAGPDQVRAAQGEIASLVEQGSSVLPQRVAMDPPRNVALVAASYGDGLEGGQVRFRAMNYGPDATEVACDVTLPDGADIRVFADLPPEGEGEEGITIPNEAQGGVGEVRCEDPDLPLDDAYYFHLPRVGASRVLVVDGDPGDTPTRSEVYFLERALAPWGGLQSGLTLDVTPPGGLTELDADEHRVVFLANVADPRPYGPRLVDFVRRGGNIVISGGDNVTADRYNAALGAVLPGRLRLPRSIASVDEDGVPLSLPDAQEELFAPFKRSGRQGFTRVRAHTVLTFDELIENDEVSVLMRWENGLPALVERKVGAGRVLVWTTSVDLGWGDLPLQAVFMPMMQRLVGVLGGDAGSRALRIDGAVGRRVEVPLPDLNVDPVVIGPQGKEQASRIDGSSLSFTPERPGAYEVQLQSGPPLAWVAVNTLPEESDVRPGGSVEAIERDLDPELLTQRFDLAQPLWGLGLLAMLLQGLWQLRRPLAVPELPAGVPPVDEGAS